MFVWPCSSLSYLLNSIFNSSAGVGLSLLHVCVHKGV